MALVARIVHHVSRPMTQKEGLVLAGVGALLIGGGLLVLFIGCIFWISGERASIRRAMKGKIKEVEAMDDGEMPEEQILKKEIWGIFAAMSEREKIRKKEVGLTDNKSDDLNENTDGFDMVSRNVQCNESAAIRKWATHNEYGR